MVDAVLQLYVPLPTTGASENTPGLDRRREADDRRVVRSPVRFEYGAGVGSIGPASNGSMGPVQTRALGTSLPSRSESLGGVRS